MFVKAIAFAGTAGNDECAVGGEFEESRVGKVGSGDLEGAKPWNLARQ